MNPQKIIAHIKKYINQKGFCFEDGMIENFYLCLKSKPFIILHGPDGCGKYTFASEFCSSIGANAEDGRFKVISVGADNYSKTDFLGYKNTDGDATEFIAKAIEDAGNPYFIYLDNMNMSNPDSYLYSVYTALDTGRMAEAPSRFYPDNLYIIGSFDSDCDYYSLSLKIRNRANVIPMHMCDSKAKKEAKPIEPVLVKNDFLKQEYFDAYEINDTKLISYVYSLVDEINRSFCYIDREISYRCRNEILFYLMLNKEFNLLEEDQAFDNIILQKILTRIEGNSAYIVTILSMLFKLCVPKGVGDYASSSLKMFRALTYPDCRYPKSAKKIAFMTKKYEDNGYITY